MVGINSNYGDIATIDDSCGKGMKKVCQEYKGVIKGQGKSEKVSSTGNCRGSQRKLGTLPAC